MVQQDGARHVRVEEHLPRHDRLRLRFRFWLGLRRGLLWCLLSLSFLRLRLLPLFRLLRGLNTEL